MFLRSTSTHSSHPKYFRFVASWAPDTNPSNALKEVISNTNHELKRHSRLRWTEGKMRVDYRLGGLASGFFFLSISKCIGKANIKRPCEGKNSRKSIINRSDAVWHCGRKMCRQLDKRPGMVRIYKHAPKIDGSHALLCWALPLPSTFWFFSSSVFVRGTFPLSFRRDFPDYKDDSRPQERGTMMDNLSGTCSLSGLERLREQWARSRVAEMIDQSTVKCFWYIRKCGTQDRNHLKQFFQIWKPHVYRSEHRTNLGQFTRETCGFEGGIQKFTAENQINICSREYLWSKSGSGLDWFITLSCTGKKLDFSRPPGLLACCVCDSERVLRAMNKSKKIRIPNLRPS